MNRFVVRTSRVQSSANNLSQPLLLSEIESHVLSSRSNQSYAEQANNNMCPQDISSQNAPFQPKHCKFRRDENKRRFNIRWYDRFCWLEYSVERNAAFCFACRKFGRRIDHTKETTFTICGFRGWKRAVEDKNKGLEMHDTCHTYIHAIKDWSKFELRLSTDATAGALVSSKVIENNWYYIRSIAAVIQFLALNELSLCGDFDEIEGKEMGHSVNLFEYTLMKDGKLAEIQKHIPQNAKYTSPNIQNDTITEMASMVTENVSNEVQCCDLKMFTLLADGTKDKSGFENISASLRYIKNGKPFESLLKMPKADKLGAQSLRTLLLNT